MEHPELRGHLILAVKSDLQQAMQIMEALEQAGAHATLTTTVRHALLLVEHNGLSAAVLDPALSDGDKRQLWAQLNGRGIPYVSYPGSRDSSEPANADALMSAVEVLLARPPQRASAVTLHS